MLGDQLSHDLSSLAAADPDRDLVVMAEVRDEGTYVPHHPKKIALVLSAMRHFAGALREQGWQVAYTTLDDPENSHSLHGEVLRRAAEHGPEAVLLTDPGEHRLREMFFGAGFPLPVARVRDTRFIATEAAFAAWAKGRKALRMEYFYREMRRKTGLLMEGDAPVGGKWNFDAENRKPAAADLFAKGPPAFEPDEITQEVLALVEREFGGHFGALRPFNFAVTRAQALEAQAAFLDQHLRDFGTYQDAMLQGDRFLHHSVLSPYLNLGLLDPLALCRAVEERYRAGAVPLNSAEGFIRQIIGWREYVRGLYFHEGPAYVTQNALGATRDLPPLFWGAKTKMNCLGQVVAQTREEAYAHHIQRLMVTGNFATLAGIDPAQVHEWYLAVYADAYEWVEAPNTVGMSQFADGGVIASKPYVSSGNYIAKMSDYCAGCAYSVTTKTGKGACPFNLLYWAFLERHKAQFAQNPRMGPIYATWTRMDDAKRQTILREAAAFLDRMEAGDGV